MSNPLMNLGAFLQAGKTPQQALALIMQSNPQARQLAEMMRGKTPAQLEQMARNMARERGTTIEDVARSMGITIPSNR